MGRYVYRYALCRETLTATVGEHAPRAHPIVALETLLLDGLLRRDVARGEEHRRGDGLREQRPRGELALVPTSHRKGPTATP